MPLVTPQQVLQLTGEASTVDCTMQIDVADTIVQENLVPLALFSAATLANIELYLAAHLLLVSLENGPLVKKEVNTAVEMYRGEVYGPGFLSTRFGQTACMLDTSGTLSAMANGATKPMLAAMFEVVGNNPADNSDNTCLW